MNELSNKIMQDIFLQKRKPIRKSKPTLDGSIAIA